MAYCDVNLLCCLQHILLPNTLMPDDRRYSPRRSRSPFRRRDDDRERVKAYPGKDRHYRGRSRSRSPGRVGKRSRSRSLGDRNSRSRSRSTTRRRRKSYSRSRSKSRDRKERRRERSASSSPGGERKRRKKDKDKERRKSRSRERRKRKKEERKEKVCCLTLSQCCISDYFRRNMAAAHQAGESMALSLNQSALSVLTPI